MHKNLLLLFFLVFSCTLSVPPYVVFLQALHSPKPGDQESLKKLISTKNVTYCTQPLIAPANGKPIGLWPLFEIISVGNLEVLKFFLNYNPKSIESKKINDTIYTSAEFAFLQIKESQSPEEKERREAIHELLLEQE